MKKQSGVALIMRGVIDREVLVTWNRQYKGWTLPGGKVEEGETPYEATIRELREETGIRVSQMPTDPVFSRESASGSGRLVHVFRPHCFDFNFRVIGTEAVEPTQKEKGAPVGWMLKDEFIQTSAFRSFHEEMFRYLEGRTNAVAIETKVGPLDRIKACLKDLEGEPMGTQRFCVRASDLIELVTAYVAVVEKGPPAGDEPRPVGATQAAPYNTKIIRPKSGSSIVELAPGMTWSNDVSPLHAIIVPPGEEIVIRSGLGRTKIRMIIEHGDAEGPRPPLLGEKIEPSPPYWSKHPKTPRQVQAENSFFVSRDLLYRLTEAGKGLAVHRIHDEVSFDSLANVLEKNSSDTLQAALDVISGMADYREKDKFPGHEAEDRGAINALREAAKLIKTAINGATKAKGSV